jgi:hypothetical protein
MGSFIICALAQLLSGWPIMEDETGGTCSAHGETRSGPTVVVCNRVWRAKYGWEYKIGRGIEYQCRLDWTGWGNGSLVNLCIILHHKFSNFYTTRVVWPPNFQLCMEFLKHVHFSDNFVLTCWSEIVLLGRDTVTSTCRWRQKVPLPPSSQNVVSHVLNNTSITSQRLTIIITVASLILCNVLVVFFRAMEDAELMIRLFPKHTKSYYRKGEILAALKVSCIHVTVSKNSSLCHWYLLLDDNLSATKAVNSDRLWKMAEVF